MKRPLFLWNYHHSWFDVKSNHLTALGIIYRNASGWVFQRESYGPEMTSVEMEDIATQIMELNLCRSSRE